MPELRVKRLITSVVKGEFGGGVRYRDRQCEIVLGENSVSAMRESSVSCLACRENVGVMVKSGLAMRVLHQGMELKCSRSGSGLGSCISGILTQN